MHRNAIRYLRERGGLTQAELALVGGTSQPTIAAYEAGHKTPNLATADRLARAAGFELVVDYVPPLTREDRRSLALHRAIAEKLEAEPESVLVQARSILRRMRKTHPHASAILAAWDAILRLPVEFVIEVLLGPGPLARELRHATPFAGVLTAGERSRVYREFAHSEHGRESR